MLGQLLSGLLLLLLVWGGFRVGRWFCTAYETRLGHYAVAAAMVGGAIYVVFTGDLRLTVWFITAFAGFYVGMFIGGHAQLWAEEERRTAAADTGTARAPDSADDAGTPPDADEPVLLRR